jgi:choline dehydrogenase
MVQPLSRGEVRLRSSDPADAPVVDPRYLADEADLKTLVSAVELIRELVRTAPLAEVYAQELAPGEAPVEDYARGNATTLWHPAGTCSMAGDAPVVDSELRVRGVRGLRVADASVMPTVTSGNTQAACYVIGEKAAESILAAHAAAAGGSSR